MLRLVLLAACALLAAACARSPSRARLRVTVRFATTTPLDLATIVVAPSGHVSSARLDAAGSLTLETDGSPLTLRIPEHCPLTVGAASTSGTVELTARPLFELIGTTSQVGYDAPIELSVRTGCKAAEQATIVWRQLDGRPLDAFEPAARGFRLTARTLPRSAFFAQPLRSGIVAVSPRTQGKYVLSATMQRAGQVAVVRTVTVTSSARATGLSSIAVSQRVMLGGAGWHVSRSPLQASAEVETRAGVDSFLPEVPGTYVLRDGQGSALELRVLTHDSTPMDCGRAECHASIAEAARHSPMSHALELATAHASSAEKAAGCMLDCHVVGERGLHDGGFLDVAQALAFRAPRTLSLGALPHALSRLGGVRCTSCHGPGAISAPEGRARILRADVCATCHDAPPRYTHVTEWARSRMAHADEKPETRNKPCARCHTTGGFLDAIGARVRSDLSRDEAGVDVGIACAACHAAHGLSEGHGLVRTVSTPAALPSDAATEATVSGLCSSCHAPAEDEALPAASSAALWLGRVRLPVVLGGHELRGAAPHADIVGGCIGCHGHGTSAAQRGTDHSFAVDVKTCDGCHAKGSALARRTADGGDVVVEARSLLSVLARRCRRELSWSVHAPAHSRPGELPCAGQPELARALYLALLVAEDGAAGVHNGPFARALLSEATRLSLAR